MDGELLRIRMMLTGYNARNAGEKVLVDLLAKLGIGKDAVGSIVATGSVATASTLRDGP